MDGTNELRSSISIRPANKMQGKIVVIAIDEKDIPSSVAVTEHFNIQSSAVIFSEYVIDNIAFPPRYGNQRKSSLQVTYRHDIPCTIGIKPNGKMSGIVEIIPPPVYKAELLPTQDAFVRDSVKTLNYGTEQSMIVGHSNDLSETFRSMLQFDLSIIPAQQEIKTATLKLYNSSSKDVSQDFGIYEALSSWMEKGVTWANQPGAGSLVGNSSFGKDIGFVELDVTWIVEQWYSGESVNNGLVMKSLNESINQFVQVTTKESATQYRPTLEVEYVSTVIPSFGEIELVSNINVPQRKDLKSSIRIPIYDVKRDLKGKIRVKNPNTMLGEIFVTKPELKSKVLIRKLDKSELNGSMIVRGSRIEEILANVWVNKNAIPGIVKVPFRNDLPSSGSIRAIGKSELWSNVTVSKTYVAGSIRVRPFKDLNGSLTVQSRNNKDINSSIGMNKPDLPSNIQAVLSSYLDGTLTVRAAQGKAIPSTITVLFRNDLPSKILVVGASMIQGNIMVHSGFLKSSITIPAFAFKDLRGKATIRTKWIKDLPSTIRIGGIEEEEDGAYAFIM